MLTASIQLSSSPVEGIPVAVILFLVSRPIIRRVAEAEGKEWLIRLMTISLILHLLAAPAQIYVVNHFYHGVADWLRYDNQGASLAPGFRHFNFSLAPGNLRGIVNDGSVSIAAAIVFVFVGANQLAGFMVFSWLAFLGTILFFRAFSLTFRGSRDRRYAYLVFLFPSMIFWTADTSKEAIMTLALGLVSYGAAKLLARRRGGISLMAVGVLISAYIRPNELFLMVAGFTVSMLFAQSGGNQGAGRRLLSIVFFGSVLVLAVFLTFHYLHSNGGSLSLQQVQQNNVSNGGSGGVTYSSSPLAYPKDVYTILLDPLPINAHGAGEYIASLENLLVLGLILTSLRNLRMVPRAAFARAYVMMCLVYSAAFFYTFAALGNLGLITRERALLFPFLFVLLSIPRGPKGRPPRFDWEVRRRDRRRVRAAAAAAARRAASGQRPTGSSARRPNRPPGRLPGRPQGRPPGRPPGPPRPVPAHPGLPDVGPSSPGE